MKKTKYMFSIYAGATPDSKNSEYWDGDIVWITPADYKTTDKYISCGAKSLTKAGYNASNTTIVPAGSIIVSKRAPIGTVSIAEVPLCTNQGCLSCVPNDDVDSSFAYYALSSMSDEMQILGAGTTFKEISANTFANMKIPYFPLPEQQVIVRYLDSKCSAIDEAIERHKKTIEKLEEYRKNEISYLSTKGLGDEPLKDSNTAWYGLIPQTWEVKRFKYIAQVKSNLVDPEPYLKYPQIGPDIIEKDSGRLIGYRTVEEAGIISGNHLFYEGQLLYSKVRPALNKVVTAPFDGLCSADMYPIETSINSDYLKYLMLSNPFLEQASIIAMIRVKMPKINQEELANIICVVPPVEQQTQVVESIKKMCEKVQSAIDKHKTVIAKLEEYRKSIIYNAVTGKIDCRTEAS